MADPIILAGAGVGLFILGALFGMALERSAAKNAQERDDDQSDLTDWDNP